MNAVSDIAVLLRNGKSIRQSPDAGGLPITRIETIADGTIDPARVGFADLAESDCNDWMLRNGDILISHINSTKHLGKCAIYEGNPPALVHGMNLLALRVNQDVAASRYVYRMLSSPSFRRQLPRITKDSVNQSSFNISNFKKLQIPLPPLAEQKRIARILDAADALRAKRRESLDQLDTFLQSTFLDLFGDPVTNPMGWEVEPLRELLGEKSINGAYYPKDAYSDGGTRMVHMADAFYGMVNPAEVKRVDAPARDIEKYGLRSTDLLVTRRSLVYEGSAKPCLIPESDEPLIFESSLIRVRPDLDRALTIYLFHYLQNKRARATYVFPLVTRSTISGINQSNLMKVKVVLPPLDLQHRFAVIVESVEQQKASQSAHLAELDTLFASLQSRAFRGDL